MEETATKRLVVSVSAKAMAEQLTLTDFECFGAVHSREFLDKVWRGNVHSNCDIKKYPKLQAMIDRFNHIHRFVILCIVSCHELSHRVRTLAHFIRVSEYCLELRNYFCLMAVFSALDSIAVSKLKYLWLRLDDEHKTVRGKLAAVCDANNNFKALRNLMRTAFIEREPAIPYIGLFLSDLTFVNDGAAKLVEGFINFKRFERFTERCKIVESFQQISYSDKMKKTELALFMERDIATFNAAVSDRALKAMVASSVQNDEKNATNSERQTIRARTKRRHRARPKREQQRKPQVFKRFKK